VIEEQQRWLRQRFPDLQPRHLFIQRLGNRTGAKPYPSGTYVFMLREFSKIVAITDGKGRPVQLSHTHRFRHTRLTRLAELGLPIHVLQRYAGHASPTMSMHYVAAREEHAEQAFLATAKLAADGTRVRFSREDHDRLHLFDRADRFLPHGWCLLPPLQSCDKGNACLTCSVFVTDATHRPALQRQLAETDALIARSTAAFAQRHGRPMPADNIWLAQRRAEHAALTRLLAAMSEHPGRAVQGAGCAASCGAAAPAGPVPLILDPTRARKDHP
jgi:Phage integrase family